MEEGTEVAEVAMRKGIMKTEHTTSREGNTDTSERLAPKKKPITKDTLEKKEKRWTTDKEAVVSDEAEAKEVVTEEKEAITEEREATTEAAVADKREMQKTPSEQSNKLDLNEFSGIMEEEAAIIRREIMKNRTSQTWAEMGFKW